MRYILPLILLATSAHAAPILHSSLGTYNKAYLDFTSYPSTATDAQIEQIWSYVANVYKPFNVDVTTEYPGLQSNVAWCTIGGPLKGSAAGQSVVGNWTVGTTYGSIFGAYVYADGLGNDVVKCAIAIAHEEGHQFGLQHMDAGIMAPLINTADWPMHWSAGVNSIGVYQDDYGVLGHNLGFSTPEPSVLWVIGMLAIATKGRKPHGTH